MLDLKELKRLHDRGFALIYLHSREKRPLENGWTTGPRKTWAELKRDFNPSYNVGVRLGEASKLKEGYLMCLDLDVKDPAYRDVALKKLKEVVGDRKYVEVRSGSGNGSRHLYGVSREPFKMVELEKHKGKWELCAYSTGRQMCLPPSVHPSGGIYTWRGALDERTLPVFDHGKLLRNKNTRGAVSREGQFKAEDVNLYESKLPLDVIQSITGGEGVEDRSAALMSITMKMCRLGFTDNQILSVLSHPDHWISEAAYDHTKSRSRDRAVNWLAKYTLAPARHELHPMRLFGRAKDYTKRERTPEQVMGEMKGIREEQKSVLPDVNKREGGPRTTLRNLVHVLEECMGGGLVGFNEFTCRPYFLRDTVYGGVKGREVSEKNDLILKTYVADHYGFEPSKELCFEAHTVVADKYKFHPVKDYLESLEWDGEARLDRWLIDAFRATGPEEYLESVGRKVLCAAVARIYEPGCKFDYLTVLEGEQGTGKSMSLGMLVGAGWFADSLGDIHNKDVVDQMLGKWLIEVSELDSIRGREAEAVKAFISRQVDRVRLSYARRAEDYPRQTIFLGSTNDQEYLTDATGNRRYWPVKVGAARRKWLRENRDQLWAEAMFRYGLGEKLYLPKELEEVARAEQEKRFAVDGWEMEIKKHLRTNEGPYITNDLWKAIHFGDNTKVGFATPAEGHRIGRIMRRLGYRVTAKRTDGVQARCWIKAGVTQ